MPGQAGPGRAGPRLPGPLRATRVLSQRLTGSHPLMMEGIVHSCFCVSQGVIVVYLTISSGGGRDNETNISIINSDYLMFLFLITFFNFLQFMKLTTLFKINYSIFFYNICCISFVIYLLELCSYIILNASNDVQTREILNFSRGNIRFIWSPAVMCKLNC